MKLISGLLAAAFFIFAPGNLFAGDKIIFFDENIELERMKEAVTAMDKGGCLTIKKQFYELRAIVADIPDKRESCPNKNPGEEIAKLAKGLIQLLTERIKPEDDTPRYMGLQSGNFSVSGGFSAGKAVSITTQKVLGLPRFWNLVSMGIYEARDKSGCRGSGVVVAVVDSGIDGTPLSFNDQIKIPVEIDLVTKGKQKNNSRLDYNNHGTPVAGIIASPIAGIAPDVTLISIKVLDKNNYSSNSRVAEGIMEAIKEGADIINLSLGDSVHSILVERAVRAAYKANITVVAASGNKEGRRKFFPAAHMDSVIAVSSYDELERFVVNTSYGPHVAFIAPGEAVPSAVKGSLNISSDGNTGTSFAAPHITGVVALLIESGIKTPGAIREALKKAATPLPGISAVQQGAGKVDARKLKLKCKETADKQ